MKSSCVICGVDEAGKGSVLGPMVVAAVGIEDEDALSGIPVRDSKLLSPKQRENLCQKISDRCRISTIIISAERIDTSRAGITMNECVARAHAAAIRRLQPETAYVDACDVNPERYARMVTAHLKKPCRIISEHRADRTYPVVSAASIVAKVVRDAEIRNLSLRYGNIGSGYPSDEQTVLYLTSYLKQHRSAPSFARKSWRTVKQLAAQTEQISLFTDQSGES